MNLYCDRYATCGEYVLDRGPDTQNVARAKGWHLWRGTTMGNREQEVILGPKCVEAGRRMLKSTDPLPNQYPIPELQIVKPDDT